MFHPGLGVSELSTRFSVTALRKNEPGAPLSDYMQLLLNQYNHVHPSSVCYSLSGVLDTEANW